MISISFIIIALMTFALCVSTTEIDDDSNEVLSVPQNHSKQACETDRDCSEFEFCYESTTCISCVSCPKLHRITLNKRCPRDTNDCGPCMPGFVTENFDNPNKRTICIRVVTLAQPQLAQEPEDFVMNPSLVFGVLAISILLVTTFVTWRYYFKKRSIAIRDSWQEMGLSLQSRCGNGTSLPPPSYDDCQRNDNGSVAYSFQLRVTERPESKTTAVPFQLPFGDHVVALTPPNYDNSNTANSNVAINDSETNYPVAAHHGVDVHDESTQPSMWTPGTSYLMTANSDETDGAAKETKASPPNKRRKTEGEAETE